jgi:hypothetical protein
MGFGELPPKLHPLPPQSDSEGLKRYLLSLPTVTLLFGMHHPMVGQRRRRSCIPAAPSRHLYLLLLAATSSCSQPLLLPSSSAEQGVTLGVTSSYSRARRKLQRRTRP